MQNFVKRIPLDPQKYPNQRLSIGHADPDEGVPPQSVMSASKAVASAQRDGLFPDILAKALLIRLYAEWDERYRRDIGIEFGVKTSNVTAELMGELRIIRNWIVHKKSIVGTDASKIRVLPWKLKAGSEMQISSAMFRELVDCINTMRVEIAS